MKLIKIRKVLGAMKRWEHIVANRKPSKLDLERLKTAKKAWECLHQRLIDAGIEHELFGSLKHGGFKAHSDIDVIIYGELEALEMSTAERIISDVYREFGIKIDYLYAMYLSDENVRDLLIG